MCPYVERYEHVVGYASLHKSFDDGSLNKMQIKQSAEKRMLL
jgi:hypothetical protein